MRMITPEKVNNYKKSVKKEKEVIIILQHIVTNWFLPVFFIFCSITVQAQWQPCAGPTGGKLDKLLVYGDTIFAGSPSSIFISQNNGDTWIKEPGMPVSFSVNVFLNNGKEYFAATNKGVFTYSFSKRQWTATSLEESIKDMIYFSVGKNTDVYATDGIGLFRSPNNGLTWPAVRIADLNNRKINALGKLNDKMYVATDSGIYISNQEKISWFRDPKADVITKDFANLTDARFIESGDTLYFASSFGQVVFYTTKESLEWKNITSDMWAVSNCWGNYSIINNELFLCHCYGDILRYSFSNNTWSKFSPLTGKHDNVASTGSNDKYFFFSYDVGGIYRTSYKNKTTVKIGVGLTNARITGLDKIGDRFFAGTLLGGAFVSNDNGSTWSELNSGLKNYAYVKKCVTLRDTIWAAVFNSVEPEQELQDAGIPNAGVYFLAPGSQVWDSTKNIPSNGPGFPTLRAISLNVVGDSLIASTNNAVRISENGGAWRFFSHDKANSNTVTQTLFSKSGYKFNNVYGHSVYRQAPVNDPGWQLLYNGLPGVQEDFFLYINEDLLFVGTDEGIYKTSDFGEHFTLCDNGIGRTPIRSIVSNGNDIFAGGDNNIFWSKDRGLSWLNISTGLRNDLSVEKLSCDHDYLFAGTTSNSVWRFPMASLYTPEVVDAKVDEITGHSVAIHPEINPNGYATEVVVEFSSNAFFFPAQTIPAKGSPAKINGEILSAIVGDLNENTSYYYRIIASNNAGRKDTSSTFTFKTKSFTRLVFNQKLATEIVANGPENTVLDKDSVEIRFSLNQHLAGTKVLFSSRRLRENVWKQQQLFSSTNDFLVKLGGTQIDQLGAEYKITLIPLPAYSSKIAADTFYLGRISVKHPVGFAFHGLKHGAETKDYNLLSFPLILTDKRPAAVFKSAVNSEDYDKTKWRLFSYAGTGGNYKTIWDENPDSIIVGPGYWFAARVFKDTLVSGPGNTVANHPSFDGYDFQINLNSGFNLIGNPYNYDIPWQDVVQKNPSAVLSKLIGFETNGKTLALKYLDVLPRFGGGYVSSNKTLPVHIPAQPLAAQSNLRKSFDKDAYPLSIQLKLITDVGNVEISGLAIHPGAKQGLDNFDQLVPPMPNNFPMVVFPGAVQLVYDVQTESAAGQYWHFNIHNLQEGSKANLSWQVSKDNSSKDIILHDLQTDEMIDMEFSSDYNLEKPGDYRIYYGTKSYLDTAVKVQKTKFEVSTNSSTPGVLVKFYLPVKVDNPLYTLQMNVWDLSGKQLLTGLNSTYPHGQHSQEIPFTSGSRIRIIEVLIDQNGKNCQKVYLKAFFN